MLCLDVPQTMEFLELVKHLALLVSIKHTLYTHRYHTLVFREHWVIKLRNKFAKLGDNWSNGVVWCCIKEPAKYLENEFLIYPIVLDL